MRTAGRRYALLLWAFAACSTPTQVIVGFEAEDGAAARATSIRVRVFRDGATDASYDVTKTAEEFSFPARVPVLPEGNESAGFRVLGELSDAAGVFGTVRAETNFVAGELRYVWLRFDDACFDNACDGRRSCAAGSCEGACVVAGSDEVRPTPPLSCEAVMDGGADAFAIGDGGTDVAPVGDAGQDALDCICPCPGDGCVDGECLPAEPVEFVDLGVDHACAVTEGGVYCWGDNDALQVGGTADRETAPRLYEARDDVQAVSLGNQFTMVHYDDDTVFSFGSNRFRRLGVRDESTELPVQLFYGEASEFTQIDAGYEGGCGVSDGEAVCWGRNNLRQTGPNVEFGTVNPRNIDFNDNWIQVSLSETHGCGVKRDIGLSCWGSQRDERLGNGPMNSLPVEMVVASDRPTLYAQVSTGEAHTCGVTLEGEVRCFGSDQRGQLGNGETSRTRPGTIMDEGPMTWSQVSAGANHTCAIREGSLYCWGANDSGQLGVVGMVTAQVPLLLDGNWKSVVAGNFATCAIDESDRLHCWGTNDEGQLGLGDDDDRAEPARVCVEP